MPRVSYAFFLLGALYGLGGMIWGIAMGASQDFTTAPAHAHLNLVGWLSLAVMGGFHALDRWTGRLAWINLVLSGLGGAILPLGIGLILTGHEGPGSAAAFAGGFCALAGMLTFLLAVVRGWRGAARNGLHGE